MMDRYGTWVAAGAVAGALGTGGIVVDRRLRTRGLASALGGAAAAGYLAGTFDPRVPLFGRPPARRDSRDTFALTFDDGPDPVHTPEIGRLLAERGHGATFFVLGRAVRAHPAAVAALAGWGHEIANHGDDHRLLAFASTREVERQLHSCETAVQDAIGEPPARLFRPPHGARSPWLTATARRRGYAVCDWDGSVFDTEAPGGEIIAQRVEALMRPGAIVLLHDGDGSGKGASREQTVRALPSIVERAEARGLRSVVLSDLLVRAPEVSPDRAAPR